MAEFLEHWWNPIGFAALLLGYTCLIVFHPLKAEFRQALKVLRACPWLPLAVGLGFAFGELLPWPELASKVFIPANVDSTSQTLSVMTKSSEDVSRLLFHLFPLRIGFVILVLALGTLPWWMGPIKNQFGARTWVFPFLMVIFSLSLLFAIASIFQWKKPDGFWVHPIVHACAGLSVVLAAAYGQLVLIISVFAYSRPKRKSSMVEMLRLSGRAISKAWPFIFAMLMGSVLWRFLPVGNHQAFLYIGLALFGSFPLYLCLHHVTGLEALGKAMVFFFKHLHTSIWWIILTVIHLGFLRFHWLRVNSRLGDGATLNVMMATLIGLVSLWFYVAFVLHFLNRESFPKNPLVELRKSPRKTLV